MRYMIDEETNEFRELSEGEDPGDNMVIKENEIEFLHGTKGDIGAIFAYREGNETRIGIINDGMLLVSGNVSNSCTTALANLFGQRHNDKMFEDKSKPTESK